MINGRPNGSFHSKNGAASRPPPPASSASSPFFCGQVRFLWKLEEEEGRGDFAGGKMYNLIIYAGGFDPK